MTIPKEIKQYMLDYAEFNRRQLEYWRDPENVKAVMNLPKDKRVSRYTINKWKEDYWAEWLAITQLIYRIEHDRELFYPEEAE